MNIYPNDKLIKVLAKAYEPRCPHFSSHGGACPESRWKPECGHVPRGFLGATGALQEVKVVMILAEPGNPQHDEEHDPDLDAEGMLKSTVRFVYRCYHERRGKLHRNARWFLDCLYPGLGFDQQLRRVWLTESRLCSLNTSGGSPRADLYTRCEDDYLTGQLKLLANAPVVAFGGKAQATVKRLRVPAIAAHALAPRQPTAARLTWETALKALKEDAL